MRDFTHEEIHKLASDVLFFGDYLLTLDIPKEEKPMMHDLAAVCFVTGGLIMMAHFDSEDADDDVTAAHLKMLNVFAAIIDISDVHQKAKIAMDIRNLKN